jgi:hypothetical protein
MAKVSYFIRRDTSGAAVGVGRIHLNSPVETSDALHCGRPMPAKVKASTGLTTQRLDLGGCKQIVNAPKKRLELVPYEQLSAGRKGSSSMNANVLMSESVVTC